MILCSFTFRSKQPEKHGRHTLTPHAHYTQSHTHTHTHTPKQRGLNRGGEASREEVGRKVRIHGQHLLCTTCCHQDAVVQETNIVSVSCVLGKEGGMEREGGRGMEREGGRGKGGMEGGRNGRREGGRGRDGGREGGAKDGSCFEVL